MYNKGQRSRIDNKGGLRVSEEAYDNDNEIYGLPDQVVPVFDLNFQANISRALRMTKGDMESNFIFFLMT